MSVRPKNDVEGCHRRLNGCANSTPPFYLLLILLFDEAQVAVMNVGLVTALQLRRYHRRGTKLCKGKHFTSTTMDLLYNEGTITATGLLKHFRIWNYFFMNNLSYHYNAIYVSVAAMYLHRYMHHLFIYLFVISSFLT